MWDVLCLDTVLSLIQAVLRALQFVLSGSMLPVSCVELWVENESGVQMLQERCNSSKCCSLPVLKRGLEKRGRVFLYRQIMAGQGGMFVN